MIKVYVDGEYYARFENEEQLDNWYQAQGYDFALNADVHIEYED